MHLILSVLEYSLSCACVFFNRLLHLNSIHLETHSITLVKPDDTQTRRTHPTPHKLDDEYYLYAIERGTKFFIKYKFVLIFYVSPFWHLKIKVTTEQAATEN